MKPSDLEIDKEILDGFLTDSSEIIAKLKEDLNRFTETREAICFEQFGQGIDRIMGAALTLGFKNVGELARLGKEIGYKAGQLSEIEKLLSLQSILSQLVKQLTRDFRKIKEGTAIDSHETQAFIVKLDDINRNLGNLRSSVKVDRL